MIMQLDRQIKNQWIKSFSGCFFVFNLKRLIINWRSIFKTRWNYMLFFTVDIQSKSISTLKFVLCERMFMVERYLAARDWPEVCGLLIGSTLAMNRWYITTMQEFHVLPTKVTCGFESTERFLVFFSHLWQKKSPKKHLIFFFKNKTFLEIVVHLAAVLNCRKKKRWEKIQTEKFAAV
jgi:hypothetical protein